jgi:hypothetical protein
MGGLVLTKLVLTILCRVVPAPGRSGYAERSVACCLYDFQGESAFHS